MKINFLAQKIIETLVERQETLSLAESCTGGMIAEKLSDIPGASQAFLGGVVAYADDAKIKLLHVPTSTIAKYGAVSEQVAFYMAKGALKSFRSTWSLSVTGISGPTGATADKPIGTTCFGMAGPSGIFTKKILLRDLGRQKNRNEASEIALAWLLRELTL